MIVFISDFAASHWSSLIRFNVQSSLFIALTLVLAYFLRRYPARYTKGLMLAGLIKLFIPSFISLSGGAEPVWRAGNELIVSALASSSVPGGRGPGLPEAALLFWLGGITAFTLLALIRARRIRAALRHYRPYRPEPWERELLHPDRVRLLQASGDDGPMLTGIFRPKIILPAHWQAMSLAQRRIILTHEISHLRGRDNIIILFTTLARVIYFFNPLVWLLCSRLHSSMEKSCDDATVRTLSLSPRDYSGEILAISEKNREDVFSLSAALSFSRTHKNLKERMLYQLKRKERAMRKPLFYSMLIILTAAFVLAASQGLPSIKDRAVDFFDLSVKPRLTHKESPAYPELARKAGIEGRVTVLVYLDETGRPLEAEVVRSVHKTLDEAAVNAALKCRFTPGEKDKKKVACKMAIPFDFLLAKK